MNAQFQHSQPAHPWQGKRVRFSLILGLGFVSCIIFAIYDGRAFYASYLAHCLAQPDRAECKPLGVVKPVPQPTLGITVDYGKGNWALQVANQLGESQASALVARLQAAGVIARIVRIKARKGVTLYQVQLGRFTRRKDAAEAGKYLHERGIIQNFVLTNYAVSSGKS